MAQRRIHPEIPPLPGESTHPGLMGEDLNANFDQLFTNVAFLFDHFGLQMPELTLNALALSSTSLSTGTAFTGTINGVTAGSTLTALSLPDGVSVNGAARTFSWSGEGSPGNSTVVLREVNAGFSNSPRISSIPITVSSPSVFTGIKFVGDSQSTSAFLNQELIANAASTSYWPQLVKNDFPNVAMFHIGQPGQSMGTPANRNDASNSIYGRWALLIAGGWSHVYIENGPNDDGLTVTEYLNRMQGITEELRALGKKVIWATIPPKPLDLTPNVGPAYNSWRDAINAGMYSRGLAIADAIAPLGSHPNFGTSAAPSGLLPANIHWDVNGQQAGYLVAREVSRSISSLSVATSPTPGNWFAPDETAAAINADVVRSYMVTGLGLGTTCTATIAGPGGTFAISNNAQGTGNLTVRNGDVVTLVTHASATASTLRTVSVTLGQNTDSLSVTTAAGVASVTTFDPAHKQASAQLSLGNRNLAGLDSQGFCRARSTTAAVGKKYAEFTILNAAGTQQTVGIVNSSYANGCIDNIADPNAAATGCFVYGAGISANVTVYHPNAQFDELWVGNQTNGDIISIAVDETADLVWFARNGVWMSSPNWVYSTNTPLGNPGTGFGGFTMALDQFYLFATAVGTQSSIRINCGQDAFAYAVPAGFSAWG